MGFIKITLTSTPDNEILAKLAGSVVYTEEIPAILDQYVSEAISVPIDITVIAFLGFKGSDFESTLAITTDLSLLGIPSNFSKVLLDVPLGTIGAYIARLKFGDGVTETLTAVLSYEPTAVVAPAGTITAPATTVPVETEAPVTTEVPVTPPPVQTETLAQLEADAASEEAALGKTAD